MEEHQSNYICINYLLSLCRNTNLILIYTDTVSMRYLWADRKYFRLILVGLTHQTLKRPWMSYWSQKILLCMESDIFDMEKGRQISVIYWKAGYLGSCPGPKNAVMHLEKETVSWVWAEVGTLA